MSDYTQLKAHVSVIQDLAPNSFPGEIVDVAIYVCKQDDRVWQEGYDKGLNEKPIATSTQNDKQWNLGYEKGYQIGLTKTMAGQAVMTKVLTHLANSDPEFQNSLHADKKIMAVKRLRFASGCSLKEAKDVADVLFNDHKLPSTDPTKKFYVEERLNPWNDEVSFAWACKTMEEAIEIKDLNTKGYPNRDYTIKPAKATK